jgi:hypothetical protein
MSSTFDRGNSIPLHNVYYLLSRTIDREEGKK